MKKRAYYLFPLCAFIVSYLCIAFIGFRFGDVIEYSVMRDLEQVLGNEAGVAEMDVRASAVFLLLNLSPLAAFLISWPALLLSISHNKVGKSVARLFALVSWAMLAAAAQASHWAYDQYLDYLSLGSSFLPSMGQSMMYVKFNFILGLPAAIGIAILGFALLQMRSGSRGTNTSAR